MDFDSGNDTPMTYTDPSFGEVVILNPKQVWEWSVFGGSRRS